MLVLDNIKFSYRKNGNPALQGISAVLEPGIHLLAGENGAGKTTLLHLMAGLLHPSEGSCSINGTESASDKPSEKGRTFLLEENMRFPGKSIREFATLHSSFYKNFSNADFNENLKTFGLTGNEPFKSQSLGNRKKAQLAYALALGVDVLLLDEPTNALDIQSKEILKKLLATSVEPHQTVVVATHTVSELENLFDAALMITRSYLLFAGTADAVTDTLAFKVTRMPDSRALYSEVRVGHVAGIYLADEDEQPTNIDWRMLYCALHSNQRDSILAALTNDQTKKNIRYNG